ncbi:protease [Corynebacterium poyangense]|uniref:Protease n=1 Tax=Corynebacterium poyangense TaxID=2684405 RepID=A0A7H0SKY1_9CORY|nr:DJ-1/PfpI family protein [Corynebacterium poyangense]QNQ89206.1 protease [Corynebacterium poyangense]
MSKQIAIVTADYFEESEVIFPYFHLKGKGYEVKIYTPNGEEARGKNGMKNLPVSGGFDEIRVSDIDALIIPGGFAPDIVRRNETILRLVKKADKNNTLIAMICHGAWVAISAKILNKRKITAVPVIRPEIEGAGGNWQDESVVVDRNMVTAQVPNDLYKWLTIISNKLEEGMGGENE